MEQILFNVIDQTLGLPEGTINLQSSSENVEKWDSLAHMNLIFSIEDSFSITFGDEQLTDSMSVKSLLAIVSANS